MSISFKFVSFDSIFQTTINEKILINEIDVFNNEYREILNNMIVKNYTEDTISLIPSCQCGHIQGTYYIGERCPKCNTLVEQNINDEINYLIWVKSPIEVKPFISPIVLTLLEEKKIKINKNSIDFVKWLIVPAYRNTCNIKNTELESYIMEFIKRNKIERSYNSFIDNFDIVLNFIRDFYNKLEPRKAQENNFFFDNLIENKDLIFSYHLPFPNRIIFAYESNELGKFVDKSIIIPINSIRRLSGIDIKTSTSINKQNKVAVSLYELANFYKTYLKNNIFSKPGLVRQHILSTRAHFTARAVITSLNEIHDYDEIHIPWSVGVSLLREHIINKLIKKNFTFKQTVHLLSSYTRIYHPLLDEIFKELVLDSETGIKAFFNRNPSLTRSSIQSVRITKIKPDVEDNTISMSTLIAPGYNADYDGDSMNLSLVSGVSEIIKNEMHNFEPHNNILTLTGLDEFSNNIKFPKPVISTIANYFRDRN